MRSQICSPPVGTDASASDMYVGENGPGDNVCQNRLGNPFSPSWQWFALGAWRRLRLAPPLQPRRILKTPRLGNAKIPFGAAELQRGFVRINLSLLSRFVVDPEW